MAYSFSSRSLRRLSTVSPELQSVFHRAIELTPIDFTVLEGIRTEARQRQLYNSGASQTMNSRHLTGDAVDVAPYIDFEVSWHWPHYYPLAEAIKAAASELNIPIEWGGDWKSFADGPHWQTPW